VVKSDDLVQQVVRTTPGTTVPVKVIRGGKEQTMNVKVEELDLDNETNRPSSNNATPDDTGAGFGITLNNLTPDLARRLEVPSGTRGAVVTDVDPDGPAARSGLRPNDVILQVNRAPVSNANEAGQALRAVAAGRTVGMLILRNGEEQFITIRKQ
jgi:serine protease Do